MPKPKVIIWGEASVDGRITIAPGTLLYPMDPRWEAISPPSQTYRHIRQMHQPQAFLEGSHSFMAEDQEPGPFPAYDGDPSPLYEDFLPEHIVNRAGHVGWFTAVDSRGRVRWYYKEFPDEEWQGWYALSLVTRATPPAHLAFLRQEDVPYLVCGENSVDLKLALDKLNTQLGVSVIVSTSPGKLGLALLQAGLVDEINIEFLPAIVGGTLTPALFGGPSLLPGELPVRLNLLSAQVQANGRVWLRYEPAVV